MIDPAFVVFSLTGFPMPAKTSAYYNRESLRRWGLTIRDLDELNSYGDFLLTEQLDLLRGYEENEACEGYGVSHENV